MIGDISGATSIYIIAGKTDYSRRFFETAVTTSGCSSFLE